MSKPELIKNIDRNSIKSSDVDVMIVLPGNPEQKSHQQTAAERHRYSFISACSEDGNNKAHCDCLVDEGAVVTSYRTYKHMASVPNEELEVLMYGEEGVVSSIVLNAKNKCN